eukprot:15853_1
MQNIRHVLRQSAMLLIGNIIKNYIDDNTCEYIAPKSFDDRNYTLLLLDQVLVYGGFPIDLVYNRHNASSSQTSQSKQVDVIFNLKNLTKLQLGHIKQYHSTKKSQSNDTKCIYWKQYANKFISPTSTKFIHLTVFGYFREIMETQSIIIPNELIQICLLFYKGTEMMEFHNNPYTFNAKFFVNILKSSHILKNKLQISDDDEYSIKCTIKDDIIHESYNLKGFTICLLDVFNPNKILNIDFGSTRSKWNMTQLQKIKDDQIIPVYPFNVDCQLSALPFSIDTCVIPFSSVTEFCDTSSEQEANPAIWFWEYIVEPGIVHVNGVEDIIDKILRLPIKDCDYIMFKQIYPKCEHFWKLVKRLIVFNDFIVDDSLMNIYVKHYNEWLNKLYFENERNQRDFINEFKNVLINECKSIEDVKKIFGIFTMLQFTEKFSKLLEDVEDLNAKFCEMVETIEDQRIVVLLLNCFDL